MRQALRWRILVGVAVIVLLAVVACAKATPTPTPRPTATPTPRPTATATPTPTMTPTPTSTPTMAAPTGITTPANLVGYKMKAPDSANPKRGGVSKSAFGVTIAHYDIQGGGGGAHFASNLYNNLIRLNLEDGLRTIIPDLAESWEISPDGMTYTFKLRRGVKFHDGTSFDADDVVATFDRIIHPPEGFTSTQRSIFDAIDKIEALDTYTVKFTLGKTRVWQFDLFTSTAAVILSKEQLEANNYDLRTVPFMGTGPFVLKDFAPAEYWVFEANPNYWDPNLPYVDANRFLHVPAWTDRGTAVLTGQADWSWNVSRDTWEEGRKRSDINTALLDNFGTLEVRWNHEKAPFDDVRVRRALFLAVNRHDAVKVYREEWNNLSRWMSPGGECATPYDDLIQIPGYREDNSEDIAEAKRLLAEAGYPDGNGMRSLDLVSASVPGHSEVLAPFFADQIRRNLGIDITIRSVERAMVIEEFKKDFDMVLSTIYHSPIANHTPQWQLVWRTGGAQNFTRYSDPEFDKVVDQLNAEMDKSKRCDLFRKGEDILDADAVQFNFGFTSHMPMWHDYVKGLELQNRVQTEWGRIDIIWLDK